MTKLLRIVACITAVVSSCRSELTVFAVEYLVYIVLLSDTHLAYVLYLLL